MDELLDQPKEVIEEAMNQIELLPEQKIIIVSIIEWAKRMTKLYGETITDKSGKTYDWGQALCREQFGIDWENYMRTRNIAIPTKSDLERALAWEQGDIPDWIKSN